MAKEWLKHLIQQHRPKSLSDELLDVRSVPEWQGNALHIMLRNTNGIESKVGHVYPGAEWVTEENENQRVIHFKLYGGEAQHYAQQFNCQFADRSISPEAPASPNPIDLTLRTLAANCKEPAEYGTHHDGQPYVILRLPDSKAVNRALWTLQSAREDDTNVIAREPQIRGLNLLKVSLRGSLVSAFDQQLTLYQSTSGQPIDARGAGASR